MLRFFLTIITCVLIAGHAYSDDLADAIQAYNIAQQSGNSAVKIDAARNLGTIAMSSPAGDDTPVLIFEAAKTLVVQDAALDATVMANWLEMAALENSPQIDPASLNVLVDYVRWVGDPNKSNRQSLDEALLIVEPLQPTLLSLVVFQKRYAADLEKGNSRAVVTSAGAAAAHIEPVKHIIGEVWSNAVIVTHSSLFNSSTSQHALIEMARHEIALRQMHAQMHSESSNHPEWINTHLAVAETWRRAMEAYFDSDASETLSQRSQRREQVDQILNWKSPIRMSHDDDEVDHPQLPLCAGQFDMKPKLRYPRRASRKGRVGAVLLSVDLNNGRVSNVDVLAAVPDEGFADEVVETVQKWSWVVDAAAMNEPCTRDAKNIRWPFAFSFKN